MNLEQNINDLWSTKIWLPISKKDDIVDSIKKEIDISLMSVEEKTAYFVGEIIEILYQLKLNISIDACKCSYFPLRSVVEMSINWELWMDLKISINDELDLETIELLASLIAKWNL